MLTLKRHGDDVMGSMDSPSSPPSDAPLTTEGYNLSDPDSASEFLEALLDDTQLQVSSNAYARYFWYGVVVVVAIAALSRLARWLTLRGRLRQAAQDQPRSARPQNAFMVVLATVTALGREASYLQLTPTSRPRWLCVPPFGTIILVLAYLGFVLALEFVQNDVPGAQHLQAFGIRAGWLAVAQMPLVILLIGKNNLIGLATGLSYERLNILHRWSARVMLLLAIMHFGFQNEGWRRYGVMELEWTTDSCPPTGMAAFAILLWMNLSTIAPFRNWPSYEFFVIQHIVTFIGFLVAIMYHLPSTALYSRVYIYIPIGLYVVDRLVRLVRYAYTNMRLSRATLVALDGGVTKIRLRNQAIRTWRPGSHVLISIPRYSYWQTHPATIVSSPQSHHGDLMFILKSHKGFTKRLVIGANDSSTALLPHTKQESSQQQNAQIRTYYALLDGPYGGSQSDFAAFDSVCLVAGSTGVTFTLALLQNIADRAALKHLPVRRVHLVWCVKRSSWAGWANAEIGAAVAKLRDAGIEVGVSIYVTCADNFTEATDDPKVCPCACDKSLGPCCCVRVDEDDDGEVESIDAIAPADNNQSGTEGNDPRASEKRREPSSSSFFAPQEQNGIRLPILPCATFYSGRPGIESILIDLLDGADGESGVAVCGPVGMNMQVRNSVVKLSDERAIHKGTGAQGLYLHVESFS